MAQASKGLDNAAAGPPVMFECDPEESRRVESVESSRGVESSPSSPGACGRLAVRGANRQAARHILKRTSA